MPETPIDRLNYSGDITPVIRNLCDAYDIGPPTHFSLIETGYEDCNIVIETSKGKYVAKIFSKIRTPEAIARYADIMRKVQEAGVNHPKLTKTDRDELVYVDQTSGLSLVLMDFVDGKSFLELNRAPDGAERQQVLEQAALVNRIDYNPPFLLDSWAVSNIRTMYEKVQQFIQPDDLTLVRDVLEKYTQIPANNLPHCFVHGDFTKANVLKGNDGKIYILDFSVANWYPRIQELAVIVANLLHDDNDPTTLADKCSLTAEEYGRLNPLTEVEKQYLYPYTLAAVAMEFMGAHQEKYINGQDTEETDYWLNIGRKGLRKSLPEEWVQAQ